MKLLSTKQLSAEVGLGERRISELAQAGRIPFVPHMKNRRLFVLDAVRSSLAEIDKRDRREREFPRCNVCQRELPRDAFLTITVRDRKRCRPGWSWTGPSPECRECRKAQRVEQRRKKAAAEGRSLLAKGEWQAQQKAARSQRKTARRVAWALCLAFRALVRLTPEEQMRRAIDRQRERYNTDPEYQAKRKATKIRRKRAIKGTQVVPVNRELVAQRDGWCCGICGGKVTRKNWSLDHIIPLSKGGAHTYENVVLAHRGCNSRRGPGRLPVQAPLFAMLPVAGNQRATEPCDGDR